MPNDIVIDWGLKTGLSLSILIAFILIIRKPFARRFGARAAYALWALPALRLFMPAFSLPVLGPSIPEMVTPINYMGVDMVSLAADTAAGVSPGATDFSALAVTFWLLGAAAWLIWQLVRQHFYVRGLLANSRDISTLKAGLCNAGVNQAAEKLGFKHPPHIRISRGNQGPLVTKLFSPMIILPSNFETQFTPHQQHLALLHEMAHIRRNDLWAAFAVILLRALFWPNPLIHYAARKFRSDQEAACDASVLRLTQTRISVYAETLIQAAKSTQHPAHEAPLGLTIYHPLKERLMTMKTHNKRSSLTSRAAACALIAGVFALTAPFTLAEGAAESALAGAPASKNTSKQKIKMIEDVNGVKTEKQYEIETVDGVTKAWSVDEWGHRMEIGVDQIKNLNHMKSFQFPAGSGANGPLHMTLREFKDGDGNNRMIVKRAIRQGARFKIDKDGNRTELKDGEFTPFNEKDIEALIEGAGSHMAVIGEDGQISLRDFPVGKDMKIITMTPENFGGIENDHNTTVVIENMSEHDMDFDFEFEGEHYGPGQPQHAKIMMEAASGILGGVQADKLSSKAQRKIEKARKALQEAQDAIDAEK